RRRGTGGRLRTGLCGWRSWGRSLRWRSFRSRSGVRGLRIHRTTDDGFIAGAADEPGIEVDALLQTRNAGFPVLLQTFIARFDLWRRGSSHIGDGVQYVERALVLTGEQQRTRIAHRLFHHATDRSLTRVLDVSSGLRDLLQITEGLTTLLENGERAIKII